MRKIHVPELSIQRRWIQLPLTTWVTMLCSYGKWYIVPENRNTETSGGLIMENNDGGQHWWKVEFKEMNHELKFWSQTGPHSYLLQTKKKNIQMKTNQINQWLCRSQSQTGKADISDSVRAETMSVQALAPEICAALCTQGGCRRMDAFGFPSVSANVRLLSEFRAQERSTKPTHLSIITIISLNSWHSNCFLQETNV